jgi:hypothetical protein
MKTRRIRSLFASTAVLCVAAACSDSPTQQSAKKAEPTSGLEVRPTGPMNDHVPGEGLSVHSVGVVTNGNATNNVRIIWHSKAGVADYHVQLCADQNCSTSLSNNPNEAGTTLAGMTGHLYKDLTVSVPATLTTYYARVKGNGVNCPGGTQNSPECFNRFDVAGFTLGTANQSPSAVIEGPSQINEGSAATFDGGDSSDPDADALTYKWDLNDDGSIEGTSVTYSTPTYAQNGGPFVVRLTVSDGKETVSVTAQFMVLNVAPAVSMPATSTLNEGATYSASGSFSDVGGDGPWTASVNYGDGTVETLALNADKTFSLSHAYADDGTPTITVSVTDKDGGVGQGTVQLTVNNVAPTATLGAPSPVNEGSNIALSLTGATDASTVDATSLTYAFDCGTGSGYSATSSTNTASCPTNDNGSRTVKGKVLDKDGGSSEYTATVTINNVAPTATFNAPSPVNEGSNIALSLTGATDASSADAASLTFAFDCGTGSGYGAESSASTASCPTTDNGTRTVKGKVLDKDGGATEYTGTVTVQNVGPTVAAFTVPTNLFAKGQLVTVSSTFTDPGSGDTHTGAVQWDIGGAFVAAVPGVDQAAKSITASSSTLAAGVYTVTLRVTDDDGVSDDETGSGYIVVYDPNGGFVTGGGWIQANAGDCTHSLACETASGRASFGFVSKYLPGRTTPDGNTEFEFKAGNFRFKSTSYEWLVVAGARAQYKGDGTVNGGGAYGFLLTAIDGAVAGGGAADRFRIKVWEKSTGIVVYDNQRGAADDSDATTALGGGSIVIHK